MNKISKYFATNPKKASFVKECQSMASQILGDNYDDETTIRTAEGIWTDYSGETFDAKLGIFRNGLRGYKKTKEESDHNRSYSDEEWYVVMIYSPISPATYRAMRKIDADEEVRRSSSSKLAKHGVSKIVEGPFKSYKEALKVQKEYNANKYLSDNSDDEKYQEAYKRYKDLDYSKRSFSITRDNESYYGQLIGTLLQSSVIAHLYHFQTKCRWCHTDMEEYYTEIVDLLDQLCEGILEPLSMDLLYQNVVDQADTPTEYFEKLKAYCIDMRTSLFSDKDDSNYVSIMDDIINLISKTLYRLKRFNYNQEETSKVMSKTYSNKAFNGAEDAINYLESDPEIMLHESAIVDINGKVGELSMVEDPDNHEDTCIKVVVENDDELYNLDDWDGRFDEMCHAINEYIKMHGKKSFSKRTGKSFSDEEELLQDFLGEYGLEEGEEFYLIAAAPNTDTYRYEVIKEKLKADQDAIDFIGYGVDDYYVSPYSITCDEKEANKILKDYRSRYEGKKIIKNTPYSKRKSYSEANGVEPAPKRYAVIFIPKDNELDCNAVYTEPDKEPVKCFVPDGGYNVLDGTLFLKSLQINEQDPKGKCSVKIVPAAKVNMHDEVGHYSKRRFSAK